MPDPQQKIIGYDPDTGLAIVGYDPNSGKMIFQQPDHPVIRQREGTEQPAPPMTITDFLNGISKSAGGLVTGLGEMAHKIPGVSAAVDAAYGTPGLSAAAFPIARKGLEPANTGEAIGKAGGDIAQFFIPVAGEEAAAARIAQVSRNAILAKVPAAARNMALTGLQGGDKGTTAASGALTLILPGGNAAKRAAEALDASAEKNAAQALGATTDKMKAKAATLAPEMVERGIKGSRATMLAEAQLQVKQIGSKIGDEIAAATSKGDTVSGDSIRAHMGSVMGKLFEADANGAMRVVPGNEAAVKQLAKLDQFVASLGPDIPVDKAQRLKQAWDRLVDRAGLFGNKATASASDNAKAWAYREASGAFRAKLAANPTLADLNEEYAFWKGMKDVLTKTELRTQSQTTSGLIGSIGAATGASVGATVGNAVGGLYGAGAGASVGALLGQQGVKLIQSPYWKTTVSAPFKTALADAIASDNAARVGSIMKAIVASLPSQARQYLESK